MVARGTDLICVNAMHEVISVFFSKRIIPLRFSMCFKELDDRIIPVPIMPKGIIVNFLYN